MSAVISVVIPAYNAASTLQACLKALQRSEYRDFECMVVDDGSTDDSAALAAAHGVRLASTKKRCGPGCARNLGARMSSGDILLFLDADVAIQPDTLSRIAQAFKAPALDALIGSYDQDPAAPNFLSQYKNLMHCFVHQHAKRRASTFWTGCGAIRRSIFLAAGGFDEHQLRPSIEDIKLGAVLIRAGRRIELDPTLMVKHLKRWTLASLLKTDFLDRAIPWTMLMLGERHMPNDLNVQWSQRLCVLLIYLALPLAFFYWPASLTAVVVVIALNAPFYRFLSDRRGRLFALRAIPLHLAYFVYSGAGFAIGCVAALGRQFFS